MALVKPGGGVKKKSGPKVKMGSSSSLKNLFVSQVRVDMLKLFLLNPGKGWHVRGIARKVGAEINAVRRELSNLTAVGLLRKNPQKNRLYYTVREDFPLFNEVLGLIVKEGGLGRALTRGGTLSEAKLAFISIPYLRGRVADPDEIDLLLVGRVPAAKVAKIIKDEEKRRGHEVNYTILTESEFESLKKRRDPFLLSTIFQPKVILTSGAEEYLALG